ncbi:MAG: hypothetical protein BM565_02010 [Gammaproteobacteria bacterium MedPE]|nr:MAG: hypothetical protein BM565_02010 [Gammaproteobacteria bacterium MedPE]
MRYNPFRDYDKHGCIKLPLMLFLSLAYLIKGYVIWIVSLSYRKDPSVLLNIFYPSRADFYHALMIAIPAIFCVAIFSFRRIGMPAFFESLWYKIRGLLIFCALIQIADSVWQGNISLHNIIHFNAYYGVLIDVIVLSGIVAYCALNQRVIDVSKQYPVALDEE